MTTGRLAVLSNVNMNMVIRMLQKNAQVYEDFCISSEYSVFIILLSSISGPRLSDITFQDLMILDV